MSENILPPGGEFLLYTSDDGRVRLSVRVRDSTVWLPQRLIAELFGVSIPTVNEHLANIYDEQELDPEATIRKFRIVRPEGSREVSRIVDHYNLDAILAVGYRMRSLRGTQFRQWATTQLRDLLVKGFVLDDERLKGEPTALGDYFNEIPTLNSLSAEIELARRLEGVEAFVAEAFVHELARRRPGADVAVEEVAGGRAVYAGPGSPLTETKAIGLHGPVTEADLDQMESVFFSRKEPSRVVVCPLADPSLVEGLGRRGYRLFKFENILAMTLGRDHHNSSVVTGIEVRQVDPGEADLYARVVAPNFVGPGESIDALAEMIVTVFGMENASHFLAFIDGEPAGGGAVIIHRGLALFAGAGTLVPFRNRGVHAALHHARLTLALDSGCDLAAQGADPGSTSQRNAERRNLRVAYTRAILVREPVVRSEGSDGPLHRLE